LKSGWMFKMRLLRMAILRLTRRMGISTRENSTLLFMPRMIMSDSSRRLRMEVGSGGTGQREMKLLLSKLISVMVFVSMV